MKYVVRLFEDSYEELITYYPRYYRDVREMVAILHAHGRLCDVLEDNIDLIYNDNFIDYMDEETLAKLENFLGIAMNKQRTLEERRRLVKAYFVGSGHISASMLEEMIRTYVGSEDLEINITFEPFDGEGNNRLVIRIDLGSAESLNTGDVLALLARKLPAHIWYQNIYTIDAETAELHCGSAVCAEYTRVTVEVPYDPTANDIVTTVEIYCGAVSCGEHMRFTTTVPAEYPIYDGETTVIPKVVNQELQTRNTVVMGDITVKEIPVSDVTNTSGGITITIG